MPNAAVPDWLPWIAARRSTDLVGRVVLDRARDRLRPPLRRPKPDRPATWAECIAGAVGDVRADDPRRTRSLHCTSGIYAFSDGYLQWDTTQFVFRSGQDVFGLGIVNWPFNFDKHVIRDLIVLVIYGLGVGLNLALIVMWQKRGEVKEPAPDAPAKTSRFGRPLRRKAASSRATAVPGASGGEA